MTGADALIALAANPPPLAPAARADAQRLLADTLAVGAAGAASPEALRVTPAIAQTQGGGEARLLGGGRTSAPEAAFCNGFAIHCLEWDAVHEPAVVHALSAVTAALLAASDRAKRLRSASTLPAGLASPRRGRCASSGPPPRA